MPFAPPTFNLVANVWRNSAVWPPAGLPIVTACQIRMLKTAAEINVINSFVQVAIAFPAGFDVRGGDGVTAGDHVECPAGSGRHYKVYGVDDVAKGFANEYRLAFVVQNHDAAGRWPYPTP